MGQTENSYQAEVIHPGDEVSRLAHQVCVDSYANCDAVRIIPHQPNNFRGPVGFTWQQHILQQMLQNADSDWTVMEEVENDGAGGKPQFFTLIGTPEVFFRHGWELIAMTADDHGRSGRFPAIMVNDLNLCRATKKNMPLIRALFAGYAAALKQAHLVNITGETAIMKNQITAFCATDPESQLILTWGGACIGLAYRPFLIDGSQIGPDMPIIGFWEPGYRCNGGTRLTKILMEAFGPNIADITKNPEAMAFVEKLTTPSMSYARTITKLVGWRSDGSIMKKPPVKIAGIAHITGGGLWGKFGEILPPGVGAKLNMMGHPADVLLEAQRLSLQTSEPLSDWQAYETFHGGYGMILVCEPGSEKTIMTQAELDGIRAEVIGQTLPSNESEVVVYSQFSNQNKCLSSLDPE